MNRLKFKRRITTILLTIGVMIIVGKYTHDLIRHPFSLNTGCVQLTVDKGDTLFSVLDKAKNEGIIKGSVIPKLYIKSFKLDTNIKAGTYNLSSNLNIDNIVRHLNKGIYSDSIIKVTIPEGYNIQQIANLLDSKGIIKKEDFIDSCKKYKLPKYIKSNDKKKYNLEGFLFPDTYNFEKNTKGEKILDTMINNFQRVIHEIEKEEGKPIEEDKLEQIITIASIIEKEAEVDKDRAYISSVFYNRLHKGMKLQSCATVLYAMGKHKNKIYNKDLTINSPYNTYKVKGLPVGPICSPGKASIKAAINPEKTNYLYFVSKNDGTHFFTDNYKKFLEVKKITQGF